MTDHRKIAVVLCVLGLSLFAVQQIAEAKLMAGAAKRSIAPPFPTNMGGFTDRTETFTGVHDDLFARALVLDDGTTSIVIIGSDLMALEIELVQAVKDGITAATNIPAERILVCCSHNHSAPSFYQRLRSGQADQEPPLKQFLVKQFIDAAVEGYQQKAPARAGFGTGMLRGVTRNRQQKNDDVIDPQVGVLRVEEAEGRKTIATLYNFTGHPVVLGSKNLLLSGEFPGAASRAVEGLMGGIAIYTQGACGDITVNRNGDPFMEIERIGRTIAGEVIKTSGLINCTETLPLAAAARTIDLPPRVIPSVADAESEKSRFQTALDEAKQKGAPPGTVQFLEDKLRVASMMVMRAKGAARREGSSSGETAAAPARAVDANSRNADGWLKAPVQVMRVGDVILVAIPGELFVEYALELRARIKQETQKSMCLVGYANGYLGYIVTPRGMETGGYEASVTRVDATAGRRLTEAAMDLVRELGP